ncbi:type I DNA topoisomerase [Candidatus Peregrinibacteria bacterium]|nr:type I DNA topoisomerase [Candidatus Peregrinibacteria bacterium]
MSKKDDHVIVFAPVSALPHLLIVESPAKARTIKRFLGKGFLVEASMGHVRDLPEGELGVDPANDFAPTYEVPKEKATVVRHLKAAFKKAGDLWIATDEDREGEAIGWHITQVLGVEDPQSVKRIVFHEITEEAIGEAVAHPRTLTGKLIDAQQARRILDRLVGYTLSPFLWKKVRQGLSAGRVQSVAVRLIVDRERAIRAFTAEEYWTIEADLRTEKEEECRALLKLFQGKEHAIHTQGEAEHVLAALKNAAFHVDAVDEKELRRSPAPPFTTSTLQQEAARKMGFSVKQTMVVAQQLYETGFITYMRTDSVNMSVKALDDARSLIEKVYGREYILSEPRRYKTKSKGAQEAHEAIRPAELGRTPESLQSTLDRQQIKLYTLIWNRTIATQMPAAEFRRVGADIGAGEYTFRATGQTVIFDGFLRVYAEGRDEPSNEQRATSNEEVDGEKFLPPLKEGQSLACQALRPEQHFTKPPPRYTEASLVKKLEEEGIGRPSTYAPTISTIQQREYVRKEGRELIPADIAFTVTDLLKEHFPNIVDLSFTAKMEQSLDDIAEGDMQWTRFLGGFYAPFSALVDAKAKTLRKEDIVKERMLGTDPEAHVPIVVRLGRFGLYVQIGVEKTGAKGKKGKDLPRGRVGKTAAIPKHLSMEEVTLEQALSLLSFPRELGKHDGQMLTAHLGRFGPYLKCGDATVTIPKGVDPLALAFADAVQLLTETQVARKRMQEPLKTLGRDPTTGGAIIVKAGRYGPYVTDGKTNASLGKKIVPEELTFEQAVDLLSKKRMRGPGRRWGKRG